MSRLGFLFLPSPISQNNFRPGFERMSLTALIVLRAGLRARVLGPQDDGEGVKACAKDTKMAGRPGLPMRKALQRDKQGAGRQRPRDSQTPNVFVPARMTGRARGIH